MNCFHSTGPSVIVISPPSCPPPPISTSKAAARHHDSTTPRHHDSTTPRQGHHDTTTAPPRHSLQTETKWGQVHDSALKMSRPMKFYCRPFPTPAARDPPAWQGQRDWWRRTSETTLNQSSHMLDSFSSGHRILGSDCQKNEHGNFLKAVQAGWSTGRQFHRAIRHKCIARGDKHTPFVVFTFVREIQQTTGRDWKIF